MNNFENPQSKEEVYYTAGGKTKTVDSKVSFAKKIDRENGLDTYYIKFARGRVFDPWGIYQGRERSLNPSYKRVPLHRVSKNKKQILPEKSREKLKCLKQPRGKGVR